MITFNFISQPYYINRFDTSEGRAFITIAKKFNVAVIYKIKIESV
jgi:hypothetical protein